jgi:hypothetical protein
MVTDQLDVKLVDLSTLTVGPISFGLATINPPIGLNNFNTVSSINSSLSVRIQASSQHRSGLMKWMFSSMDPSTGLPPTDPTVGFIPPDPECIKRQGSIVFNVPALCPGVPPRWA